jgi:hypothetical protein
MTGVLRRCVGIRVSFGHATGHQHPRLEPSIENHVRLLRKMRKSEPEIALEIDKFKHGEG